MVEQKDDKLIEKCLADIARNEAEHRSAEQQEIISLRAALSAAEQAARAAGEDNAKLLDLLERCYHSGHRQGWEEGPTTDEVMEDVMNTLANHGRKSPPAPPSPVAGGPGGTERSGS